MLLQNGSIVNWAHEELYITYVSKFEAKKGGNGQDLSLSEGLINRSFWDIQDALRWVESFSN